MPAMPMKNSPTPPLPLSKGSKSSSPNSSAELLSTANSSSSSSSSSRRPKRSASANIDYNLKKRRIIPMEDYSTKDDPPPSSTQAATQGEEDDKDVVEFTKDGNIIFNEPKSIDPVNGMTGLPLGRGPPEKVKKESLWNYKRSAGNEDTTAVLDPTKEDPYRGNLQTNESDSLTSLSDLRQESDPVDIHIDERKTCSNGVQDQRPKHAHPLHTKIKTATAKESKLFGQNSITNQKSLAPPPSAEEAPIENDDFCASCMQPGVFLCCDTCPKSFHFACCNPPLDPDNLPEGDWSCQECQFNMNHPNKAAVQKHEKEFLVELERSKGVKLFGKLLFGLENANPKQFELPISIREAFANVHTGPHGVYTDDSLKEPLNEKQLFDAPYGQGISKMNQYSPELHVDPDSETLLICYKCGESKMGTIDHPEDERLIMTCDYCNTPWHLDCVPGVPRASFKNLGSKWKCPLHADLCIPKQKRKLARNQKVMEPSILAGFRNNGDVEVALEEISVPMSKEMIESNKRYKETSIIRIGEDSIKIGFLDKIYRAKKAQGELYLRNQECLIDRLLSGSEESSKLNDVSSLLYFSLQKNTALRKLWDFKELCNVATKELVKDENNLDKNELLQLRALKGLLESKNKEEVMAFFGLQK